MATVAHGFILAPRFYFHIDSCRAVANGPVGPAMAGPIIEPGIFFFFLKFFIIFFGRNNNRAGIFSILFFKQRRHCRQNVHSDDSILGRFRPSHAGSHHHSMGGKGPQVHEFVGLYSDPQCDAGTTTAVVTYVFFRLNLPLNKFRRQCYKFRRQCYKFRRQCYKFRRQCYKFRRQCYKFRRQCYKFRRQCYKFRRQCYKFRRQCYKFRRQCYKFRRQCYKFRRQCYKFRRQCYKFRRQCYDGVGNMSGQRTCVAKRIQELEPGQSNHILKAMR